MMRRIVGAVAAGLSLAGASGCYTLHLAQGADIPNGTQVALEINDAGRIALGGSMGPEIAQVEGRLQSKENNEYVIAVSFVKLLRGGEQVWKGERINVRADFVSRAYERRLSRGRSIAAGTAGAAVVLYLVTRAIVGAGLGEAGKLPSDTLHTLRRPAPR